MLTDFFVQKTPLNTYKISGESDISHKKKRGNRTFRIKKKSGKSNFLHLSLSFSDIFRIFAPK